MIWNSTVLDAWLIKMLPDSILIMKGLGADTHVHKFPGRHVVPSPNG